MYNVLKICYSMYINRKTYKIASKLYLQFITTENISHLKPDSTVSNIKNKEKRNI